MNPPSGEEVRSAYGLSLLLLVASVFAVIATGSNQPQGSATADAIGGFAGLMQVAAVVVTLQVSGLRVRVRGVILALVLLAAAMAVGSLWLVRESGPAIATALWLLVMTVVPLLVAERLRTFSTVTLQMVLGYLVIYVILGITFAYGYRLAELLVPPALDPSPQGLGGSMYFSFVTLTTLGYGDVSPAEGLSQALAVLEAVLGQLYLVAVVGLVVGNLGRETHRARSTDEKPGES